MKANCNSQRVVYELLARVVVSIGPWVHGLPSSSRSCLNEQLEALRAARFSHAHSLFSPFTSPFPPTTSGPAAMLSRFAPRAFVAPVRYNVPVRATAFSPVVRRSVTTDAASSHAEKSEVPSVCPRPSLEPSKSAYTDCIDYRKTTSPSKSPSRTNRSRRTISTLRPTRSRRRKRS